MCFVHGIFQLGDFDVNEWDTVWHVCLERQGYNPWRSKRNDTRGIYYTQVENKQKILISEAS